MAPKYPTRQVIRAMQAELEALRAACEAFDGEVMVRPEPEPLRTLIGGVRTPAEAVHRWRGLAEGRVEHADAAPDAVNWARWALWALGHEGALEASERVAAVRGGFWQMLEVATEFEDVGRGRWALARWVVAWAAERGAGSVSVLAPPLGRVLRAGCAHVAVGQGVPALARVREALMGDRAVSLWPALVEALAQDTPARAQAFAPERRWLECAWALSVLDRGGLWPEGWDRMFHVAEHPVREPVLVEPSPVVLWRALPLARKASVLERLTDARAWRRGELRPYRAGLPRSVEAVWEALGACAWREEPGPSPSSADHWTTTTAPGLAMLVLREAVQAGAPMKAMLEERLRDAPDTRERGRVRALRLMADVGSADALAAMASDACEVVRFEVGRAMGCLDPTAVCAALAQVYRETPRQRGRETPRKRLGACVGAVVRMWAARAPEAARDAVDSLVEAGGLSATERRGLEQAAAEADVLDAWFAHEEAFARALVSAPLGGGEAGAANALSAATPAERAGRQRLVWAAWVEALALGMAEPTLRAGSAWWSLAAREAEADEPWRALLMRDVFGRRLVDGLAWEGLQVGPGDARMVDAARAWAPEAFRSAAVHQLHHGCDGDDSARAVALYDALDPEYSATNPQLHAAWLGHSDARRRGAAFAHAHAACVHGLHERAAMLAALEAACATAKAAHRAQVARFLGALGAEDAGEVVERLRVTESSKPTRAAFQQAARLCAVRRVDHGAYDPREDTVPVQRLLERLRTLVHSPRPPRSEGHARWAEACDLLERLDQRGAGDIARAYIGDGFGGEGLLAWARPLHWAWTPERYAMLPGHDDPRLAWLPVSVFAQPQAQARFWDRYTRSNAAHAYAHAPASAEASRLMLECTAQAWAWAQAHDLPLHHAYVVVQSGASNASGATFTATLRSWSGWGVTLGEEGKRLHLGGRRIGWNAGTYVTAHAVRVPPGHPVRAALRQGTLESAHGAPQSLKGMYAWFAP